MQYVSNELRNDRYIVLTVVQKNGLALQYTASSAFKKDRGLLLTAVQQNYLSLQFVSGNKIFHWFSCIPNRFMAISGSWE